MCTNEEEQRRNLGLSHMLQFDAESLTSLDIEISGGWHTDGKFHDWIGTATASQPLVGIALLTIGHHTEWCKSSHRSSDIGLPIHLLVRGNSEDYVTFRVGSSQVQSRVLIEDEAYQPETPPLIRCRSATRIHFAQVMGIPPIALSFVLIARNDVRSARNGLWSIRDHLRVGLDAPWGTLLVRGRSGHLEEKLYSTPVATSSTGPAA